MKNNSVNSRRSKLMINREILIHLSSRHFAKIRSGNFANNTNAITVTSDVENCDTVRSQTVTECGC